jgi:flagellar biogenesis protein FliO
MEWLSLLRMLGSLLLVLAMLVGAVWVVRRFDLRLPGRISGDGTTRRRLQIVERLSIDTRRSVLLIRCDDSEHLLLLGPDHALSLESPAAAAPDGL